VKEVVLICQVCEGRALSEGGGSQGEACTLIPDYQIHKSFVWKWKLSLHFIITKFQSFSFENNMFGGD
jgi:hypothetical protein